MAIVPVDNTHILNAIQSDTQYLRSVIQWANQRYEAYNLMCSTDAMTAANIPAEDQAYILAFIGDLNRIVTLAKGTLPDTADDMNYNVVHLLGLL